MRELLIHIASAAVLYLLFTLVQILLRKMRVLWQIRVPLNLCCLALVVHVFLGMHMDGLHPLVGRGLAVIWMGLGAYVAVRLLDWGLFAVLVPRRTSRQVPVVLRDIFKWVLLALATFWILRRIFPDLNLSVLAMSSLVVGYILGNASQDTLGNLIAGLALNTESPFSIGDWVEVGGQAGKVVDMTWRATRLKTKMEDHIIIPNATIAREPIVNYSRPTQVHGFTLNIGVSYDAPPYRVKQVLQDVLQSVPEVLRSPEPQIWLTAYGDFSINYRIKFFITDFQRLETIESRVMDLVWYHFKRAGIVIPFPIRDVRPYEHTLALQQERRVTARDEHLVLLADVDLFKPLATEERARVAAALQEQVFARGETLVREGDAGNTFYLLLSGRVRVTCGHQGQEVALSQLTRGDVFGETSLLTGAKRSATVTAEEDTCVGCLSREVFRDLMEKNTDLAADFARILEKREQERGRARETVTATGAVPAAPVSDTVLLGRILRFFGLSSDT